jgi:hypothetical protein
MKLIINTLLVFLALNAQAAPAGTNRPFEKLKALYDSGTMPTDIVKLVKAVAGLTSCAGGASATNPDNLDTSTMLSILSYNTQNDLGPEFPPEIFDYIVLTESGRSYSIYEPISNYSISNSQNAVRINGKHFTTELDCSDPDPDVPCSRYTETEDVVLDLRITPKYIVFKATQENVTNYHYCWK